MTRSDLVNRLKECNQNIDPELVERASKSIFTTILGALTEGDRVEVRGFGSFSLRHLKPHTARNPKTGEDVPVGNRFSIYFRPGKQLKERVNTVAGK